MGCVILDVVLFAGDLVLGVVNHKAGQHKWACTDWFLAGWFLSQAIYDMAQIM